MSFRRRRNTLTSEHSQSLTSLADVPESLGRFLSKGRRGSLNTIQRNNSFSSFSSLELPKEDLDNLSTATTPTKSTQRPQNQSFKWGHTDEVFTLSRSACSLKPNELLCVLEDRLYFMTTQAPVSAKPGQFFFTMDNVMSYMPFCADFGPFNLGMTKHFCDTFEDMLRRPELKNLKLVYYTSTNPCDVSNAIYLLGSFLILHLGVSPQDAWFPFAQVSSKSIRLYRDATWVPSTYDLHITDCWAGLAKAVKTGLFDIKTFDKDEYFYYDNPDNGDMHEVLKGKFYAFKGPSGRRKYLGSGRYTLLPSDYFDVFRSKNIKSVVRLNNKEYDRNVFVQSGFQHHDLFFTDCTTPSDAIVDKFLRISEGSDGALAVHCLAGLGRTGTLIALYLMKHLQFTANEAMAWLRIVRPGSVIGPQQQYLQDQQARMWNLGQKKASGLGVTISLKDSEGGQDSTGKSAVLADMVTKGMLSRDVMRDVKLASNQENAVTGQATKGTKSLRMSQRGEWKSCLKDMSLEEAKDSLSSIRSGSKGMRTVRFCSTPPAGKAIDAARKLRVR